MKTQIKNDVLNFNKSSLVELNDQQLRNTDSGITPFVFVGAIVIAAGVAVGVAITENC